MNIFVLKIDSEYDCYTVPEFYVVETKYNKKDFEEYFQLLFNEINNRKYPWLDDERTLLDTKIMFRWYIFQLNEVVRENNEYIDVFKCPEILTLDEWVSKYKNTKDR